MKSFKLLMVAVLIMTFTVGCLPDSTPTAPVASTGVKKATAKVVTQADGYTVEQGAVKSRLEVDNKVGSIKHLYIVSPASGDVILYSTVKNKVTSSGKRLTSPVTLIRGDRGEWSGDFVMPRLGDDGTYGSSVPYIYWWDVRGVYHQHITLGAEIIHISDQALSFPKIILNLENVK